MLNYPFMSWLRPNIGIPLKSYRFLVVYIFLSLKTSQMCIMGELAGCVVVAVSNSDKWQVTGDMRHMTPDPEICLPLDN